jgi:hypothetical protein
LLDPPSAEEAEEHDDEEDDEDQPEEAHRTVQFLIVTWEPVVLLPMLMPYWPLA